MYKIRIGITYRLFEALEMIDFLISISGNILKNFNFRFLVKKPMKPEVHHKPSLASGLDISKLDKRQMMYFSLYFTTAVASVSNCVE